MTLRVARLLFMMVGCALLHKTAAWADDGPQVRFDDGSTVTWDAGARQWVGVSDSPTDRYVLVDPAGVRYGLDPDGRLTMGDQVLLDPQQLGPAGRVLQAQLDGSTLYVLTASKDIMKRSPNGQFTRVGDKASPFNERIAVSEGTVFALQQNGSVGVFQNNRWGKVPVPNVQQIAAAGGKLLARTHDGQLFEYKPGALTPDPVATPQGLGQLAVDRGRVYAIFNAPDGTSTVQQLQGRSWNVIGALPSGKPLGLAPRTGNIDEVRWPVAPPSPPPPAPLATVNAAVSPDSSYKPVPSKELQGFGELMTMDAFDKRDRWKKILGRDPDVRNLEDTLLRLEKRNFVLIAEAGVGKTALLELLAQRIVTGDVAPELLNAEILKISAGTFEVGGLADNLRRVEQLAQVVQDYQQRNGKPVILFFDELHTIPEVAREELKRFLDRDTLYFGGATTPAEAGLLEKNSAFFRRLRPQFVEEPSKADTFTILRESWAPRLEKKYGITITDDAIREAIELSRYYPDRFRPDGPQDVLQDAAVKAYRLRREQKQAQATLNADGIRTFVAEDRRLPVGTLNGEAVLKYGAMEEALGKEIFGQPEAIEAIASARRRKVTGVADPNRPTVVALLGLTGTGKTELAHALANYEYGDRDRVYKISMTEMTNEGKINMHVGSPLGYKGSDVTPGLIRFLKNNPAGVIVVDEFLRGSAEARAWLFDMLESGRVTGGDGRTYSLKEYTFVVTDNAGERLLTLRRDNGERIGESQSGEELMERFRRLSANKSALEAKLVDELRKAGAPDALIQRLDAKVLLRPHTKESLAAVAGKYLDQLNDRVGKRYEVKLEYSPQLKEYLGNYDYNVEAGARNVRGVVQRLVEDNLSKAILKGIEGGRFARNDVVAVDLVGDGDARKIRFTRKGESQGWEYDLPRNREELTRQLKSEQFQKLQRLEAELGKGYFGQPEAVRAVTDALRSEVSPWARETGRPAVVTLLGLPGTGKTYLGEVVAREWYGNQQAVFDFNMARIRDYANMNLLTGAPSGYVGFEKGGSLADFLDRYPDGGVIILNEIDKAGGEHYRTQVQQELYDFLNKGEFVGGDGRVRYAKNHTIVLTANVGEKLFNLDQLSAGAASEEYLQRRFKELGPSDVDAALRESFTDAFIRRMGERVLMRPLSTGDLRNIAQSKIEEQRTFFKQRGVEVTVAPRVLDLLVTEGYRPREGASPVQGLVEAFVKAPVTRAGDEGRLRPGDRVSIDVDLEKREVVLKRGTEEVLRAPANLRTVVFVEAEAKLKAALDALPPEYRVDRSLFHFESTAGMQKVGLFAEGAYNLLTDRFILTEAEVLKLDPVELRALLVHEVTHRQDALAARKWVTPEQLAALYGSNPGAFEWGAYRAGGRYLRENGKAGTGGAVQKDADTLSRSEFIRRYNEGQFKPWEGPKQKAAFEQSLRSEGDLRAVLPGLDLADEWRNQPGARPKDAPAPASVAPVPVAGNGDGRPYYERPEYTQKVQEVADVLKSGKSFLIITDAIRPDGDTLGSGLALAEQLREMGKEADVFNAAKRPQGKFGDLPGYDRITTTVGDITKYDAVITVDFNRPENLGLDPAQLANAKRVIQIDHHATGQKGFTGNGIIAPEAGAAGEIVYDVLRAANGGQIGARAAQNLYVSLLTDTRFKYETTSPRTLRIAGEMAERAGVKVADMARKYGELRLSPSEFEQLTNTKVEWNAARDVATVVLTRDWAGGEPVSHTVKNSILEMFKYVKGAKAVVLIMEEGSGTYRVNLRSEGGFDVSRVAEALGGGGHKAAAGTMLTGDLDTVRQRVAQALEGAPRGGAQSRATRSVGRFVKNEAVGGMQFAAALLFKESAQALLTGDGERIQRTLQEMKQPMFWGGLGAFSGAAQVTRLGLRLAGGPKLLSGFTGAWMPLAAGMAAMQGLSGHFSARDLLWGTASFVVAGSAVELAVTALRLGAFTGPTGWVFGVAKLAGTLYLAEWLEGRLRPWFEKRMLQASSKSGGVKERIEALDGAGQ